MTIPATMTALTQQRYGGPDTLAVSTVATPTPGQGEVLVRMHAASINAADWLIMHGTPAIARLAFGLRRPTVKIRGRDVAGTVVALGAGATQFDVGDEIFAEVEAGSFAEYTVAAVKRCALKPAGISFEHAAMVPLAGTTALQGLRDVAALRPGQHVLVNGASGGVGSFAVLIAKALGARVTAVCSTRNLELAASLGADHVVDYTVHDFTEPGFTELGSTGLAPECYDVIFDSVGNHSLARLRGVLAPTGTLVLSSGAGGAVLGPIGRLLAASIRGMFTRQRLRPLASSSNGADLVVLRELIDAGMPLPALERTFTLAETPTAMRQFGAGHARGKLVIVM